MTPALSRTVGRILGKGAPTPQERERIIADLAVAERWADLPRETQNLLNRIKREAASPATLPGGSA